MKRVFCILTFLFVTSSLFSQTQFHMRYGSPYHDQARKIIQTEDGNYIIVGYTDGFGSGGNAFIMKISAIGTILWIKDYSGINSDDIYDIIELSDRKLVMCGGTNSYGEGSTDAFVIKTDSLGNVIWSQSYGDIGQEYFTKISKDESNGFYIAGCSWDFTYLNALILRVDSIGNIVWAKMVNDNSNGSVCMTPITSGGVVLAEAVSPNTSFSLFKYTSTGSLVWSHNYLPTPIGSGISGLYVLENSVGNILVNTALANVNTVAQSLDNFIIKLNSSGSLISSISYGGTYSDDAKTISNTNDGGIIVIGSTNSSGNGENDDCLIKISQNGSVLWAKAYGTAWTENPSAVLQTIDSGFVFTGQTWSVGFDHDSSKIHIVKTDSIGNTNCNAISWNPIAINQTLSVGAATSSASLTTLKDHPINWNLNNRNFYRKDICNPSSVTSHINSNENWLIYPNPFTKTATVENLSFHKSSTLIIFNVFGQQIKQFILTDSKTEIKRENLLDGVYLYQIISNGIIVNRGKIIIQ